MKVHVDEDMCEANGKCELAAPEVFELGDHDTAQVLVDDVPAELEQKTERAIRLCPRLAISWVEES